MTTKRKMHKVILVGLEHHPYPLTRNQCLILISLLEVGDDVALYIDKPDVARSLQKMGYIERNPNTRSNIWMVRITQWGILRLLDPVQLAQKARNARKKFIDNK